MIVYKDLLSGDEMITDAFQLLPVVDDDGAEVRVIELFVIMQYFKIVFK
jgi:hypothetical protein